MTRSRRIAALMCSAAVFTFVTVLIATTETVSARQCQEECDATYTAAQSACDGFAPDYAEVTACYSQAWNDHQSCSVNATSCSVQFQCMASYNCAFGYGWYCYSDGTYCWEV